MHPRTLLMLAISFVAGLTLAACSAAGSCTTANCGGCCDTSGKCQSGATAEACGVDGASCGRCGTGTVCGAGTCKAAATGGGGGATGGGTGGGGTTGGGAGGGGGCRVINVLETAQVNLGRGEYRSFSASPGHYNYLLWIYQGLNPDGFQLEVVYPRDVVPNFPAVERPTTATRYQTCTVCGVYHESCDSVTLVCARDYLAQGGTLTVTSVDRAPAGRARGSGTSVRFNEWNLASDVASGTGCIIANAIGPFDVGWNEDGGMIP